MIRQMAGITALALAGVLVLGAGIVLAQDVKTNYVPGTDFSKYKTYKWVAIEGAQYPDQIVDGQIKMAVDTALAGKGLTKAAGETADMFIGYQIAVDQERQWNAYGGGGLRWGGGMGTATSSTIKIGTLALDVYDPAAKSLTLEGRGNQDPQPER